jgi:hypothetical protein
VGSYVNSRLLMVVFTIHRAVNAGNGVSVIWSPSMLSPVSSPSAVNSLVPDAGVNLDKLLSAQTGDGKGRIKGDTRIAFTGVEEGLTVGGAIVWGAVVIGGAYLTYQAVAKDEYGKTGLQRQGEVISDAAQQIWDGLNNTAGRLGQAVPSLDSIKQNITEAFRAADRAGGNINKMAEGLMKRILGNGAPVATPVAPSYPTAPAAPSRPNSGTRPVAPARPNAGASQQASQQAAAQAATQTFGKVQGSVDRMNDGVVSYYNDLAGGGTGKAGLQQVKQARQAVLSEFATLKKQVAATSADFKASSQATLNGLQSALKANYNWIVSANAHRPGAALPNPPTTVAAGTPARGSGQDVASRVSSAAQGATNRTAAAPQTGKSSPASTAPTPSAAAPNNASAQQAREAQAVQTAQANAHRSVSTALGKSEVAIKTVNDGVLSFYNAASGGRAARANGAFATPLKSVQSGINELNGVVNTLKAEAGKCSPADQATVKREVKRLTDLVSSTQTWLGNAQAFSAGLSGPGGKHVAAPAVPQPPTLLSDPKHTQKGAEALRTRIDKAATAAAGKNPTVAAANGRPVAPGAAQGGSGVMNPNGFPSPTSGVSVVSEMPASVTHTKPIWINTTTGAVSDKTQSGPGWLQATLGINGDSVPSGDKTTLDTSTGGAIVVFKKPPKKPDWKKWLQIAGTIVAIVNSAALTGFIGAGFFQGEKQAKNTDADRIAGASADNTALTMPLLNRADLLTPENKGKQTLKVWEGYFDQIDKRLQANPVASTEFKQEFTAAANNFKTNLRGLVARLNTKGISAGETSDLVKAMAMPFSAPTLSVKPPQGASAEVVGKYARLNATLAGLIKSMNDGVANVVNQQINTVPDQQPSVPSLRGPAIPPTSAAPTANPPVDPNETQLKKKVADMFGDAVKKSGGVATTTAPVAPLPPSSTSIKPTPVAPTAPTRPVAPKPVVPSVAPRATTPSPATAIASIDAAVAQAGLINPPAHTDKLKDIKFTSAMFLETSKRGDLAATTAARDKAKSLYAAIAEVANRNNNPAANRGIAGGIVQGPISSLRAVIIDLNKQILEASAKPAAQPKEVPSALPSATPIETPEEAITPPSPMPSPSSTLAPEPATP